MPSGIGVKVVLLIAVLLFGANKIPKYANAASRSLSEFKRGPEELEEELTGDEGSEDDGAETAD